MVAQNTHEKYLEALLKGDRKASRTVIEQALHTGIPSNNVYNDTIWPIMNEIEELARNDRISKVSEHLATRINRTIVAQLQNKLPCRPCQNKKIAICCAQDELQELGAQMMSDIFESGGWEVRFLGGGLTNDDILAFINEYAPDILLIYGTEPKQAPSIRRLIDTIREVNAWPEMRIMVSGGLFRRADGLWQEIGADLYAEDPVKAIHAASSNEKLSEGRTIKRNRKAVRAALV